MAFELAGWQSSENYHDGYLWPTSVEPIRPGHVHEASPTGDHNNWGSFLGTEHEASSEQATLTGGRLKWNSLLGAWWGRVFWTTGSHCPQEWESMKEFSTSYRDNPSARLPVHEVGPAPNYTAISAWLTKCISAHRTCRKALSGSSTGKRSMSSMKLINVHTRTLVMQDNYEYLALSYVWGNIAQPVVGDNAQLPTHLSATVEDAMKVVAKLGFMYLWVDSICIDQRNNDEKQEQISIMDLIYEGAVATIIAVHGEDSNSGLPGVSKHFKRMPQLRARFGQREMLSLHPKLEKALINSHWEARAWTYQEGLLSRRRLYFTHYQVYFLCNETFCTEDLHSSSPSGFSEAQSHSYYDGYYKQITDGKTCLTRPGFDISNPIAWSHRFVALASSYFRRKLSSDDDALNAFSAILRRLEDTEFPDGFLQGLPCEDLRYGLLWNYDSRLLEPRYNKQFPSWSWTGWEYLSRREFGAYATNFWDYDNEICELRPPLRMWFDSRELNLDRRPGRFVGVLENSSSKFVGIPSIEAFVREIPRPDGAPDLAILRDAPTKAALFTEGIVFTVPHKLYWESFHKGHVDVTTLEKINLGLENSDQVETQWLFMAISRTHQPHYSGKDILGFISLSLSWNGSRASRIKVVRLNVEAGAIEAVWKTLKPRIERFWFI